MFLSARPALGIAGQSITQTFQSFFDARPGLTESQLVQAVRDGADFPTPGANTLFIEFRDDAVEGVFQGNIGTDFQSPETLTVYLFGDAGAADIGNITVNAAVIPEPATTALLALATFSLIRRRKQPQIAQMARM
ncbi:MAG TPA: PEP-CTERM sorting domain-containing protein [Tepidisphaeraceae bacterium]|nr:PEP-CTERM sorting domain-containing protein [Tepidisphaeraceae bacterium]